MSSRDIRGLQIEVESLRALVDSLVQRLEVVEEELARVEARQTARSEVEERSGLSSAAGADRSINRISVASSTTPVETEDRAGRKQLARRIGQFILRAVRGEPLGSSGRDRLALQNRCYLIFADYEGAVFRPPVFTRAFAEVRERCKRGADCGRSIFIGLATLWEAAIVVEEAGFDLPADLRNVRN